MFNPQEGRKTKTNEKQRKQKTMIDSILNIPIITLSVNGLNIPIKKQRLTGRVDWKKRPNICC